MGEAKVIVLKGLIMEREALDARASEHDVNDVNRPAAMPGGEPCQERIDAKAFTGRGTRPELRHLEAEIDRLEQHMAELVSASKKVHGEQFYLALHHKTSTGYTFLRWREAGGAKRHLSWEAAHDVYANYQVRTRNWYSQLSERAMKANAEHVVLRKEIRAIKSRLRKTRQATYAKSIPMMARHD